MYQHPMYQGAAGVALWCNGRGGAQVGEARRGGTPDRPPSPPAAAAEVFAASRALSCDVTHGAHPNYLGHHDPTHRAVPNGGPALKVNANQRYATDAPGAAAWARACRDADVPNQVFVSRNTVPCGSTVGPIIATRLGIRTVDVGIPVLSMHSARELCGVDDPAHLVAAATAFLADAG